MEMMFITAFLVLIITAVLMLKKAYDSVDSPKNENFRKLQSQYLMVYYIVSFSDWLQGPYVYKLYSDYGYTQNEIAVLYIVGFASSSIFGTFVGLFADIYGRKTLSASYGIIYSICCLTKLSSNFLILFVGRICGGISTSILCTTFEAWYINEHTNRYNLPMEWLNLTFSKACFYSGLLAIIAGVVSQISAEVLGLGSVSPFLIAVPFLLLSTLIILKTWSENTLPTITSKIDMISPLKLIIFKNPQLLVIGFIQSLYEATMYTFIFSWTPIITSLNPPIGLVFASFMIALMIGSKVYALLISKNVLAETVLTFTSLISFLSLTVVTLLIYIMKRMLEAGNLESTIETILTQICFFCFIIFEMCVGMYDPAITYIKGKTVPEEYRASVTNWFRVPMNTFTCLSLTLNQFYDQEEHLNTTPSSLKTFTQFSNVFFLCSVFLFVGLLTTLFYKKTYVIINEVVQKVELNKEKEQIQMEKENIQLR